MLLGLEGLGVRSVVQHANRTRLRNRMARDVGDAARSEIEVTDGAGVSSPTAHAAFVAHAETVLGNPAPVGAH